MNLCFAAKGERSAQDTEHLDFKVMVEPKDVQPYTIILVASSRQEKSAWTSDISQVCLLTCIQLSKTEYGRLQINTKQESWNKLSTD